MDDEDNDLWARVQNISTKQFEGQNSHSNLPVVPEFDSPSNFLPPIPVLSQTEENELFDKFQQLVSIESKGALIEDDHLQQRFAKLTQKVAPTEDILLQRFNKLKGETMTSSVFEVELPKHRTYSEEVESLMEEMMQYARLNNKENPSSASEIPQFRYDNDDLSDSLSLSSSLSSSLSDSDNESELYAQLSESKFLNPW